MGNLGRQYALQTVHYLRKAISFNDGASAVTTVGRLPAGAAVLRGHAVVTTAFNAGTNNNIDVGIAAASTTYTSALALTSAGVKPFTGLATSANAVLAADTDVIVTMGLTGTAATAGAAVIVIEYVVNNDK